MNWARLTRLHLFLPLAILIAGLGVTWSVWDHEREAARNELRAHFDFSMRDAVSRVEQRMASYAQMLRGVQGMFASTGALDRDSFHNYVDSLQVDSNFAGVQAIGINEWVPANRKDAHVAAMRQLNFSGYTIQPEGQRDYHAPVIQREPNIGPNRIPPGFDAWNDSVRRFAMERARDSGMVSITGKVQLNVDDGSEARPGFIMYLPIYTRGQTHDSVDQRRTHLIGWVFASFRMNDLMASLYGEQPPGLVLSIYDGVERKSVV